VILVALTGCASETSTPASVVPADAEAYVSVDPTLDRMLERLFGAVEMDAVNTVHDVQPWLGDRAAAFVVGDATAVALEVRDDEAAAVFVDEFQPSAVVGDHVIVSQSAELVDATAALEDDAALADADGFDSDAEGGERPPAAYATATDGRIADGLAAALGLPVAVESAMIELLPREGRFTMRMTIDGPATRLEIAGLGRPPPKAPSLADLPGGAWLAVAAGDLGSTLLAAFSIAPLGPLAYARAQLASGLDLDDDVFRHLGAGTFFVQGSGHTDLGARLVVEVKDETALRRAAIELGRELRPDAEVRTNRPGSNEAWLELGAHAEGLDPTGIGTLDSFFAEVESGRLDVDFGEATGGDSEQLRDMPYFQDAECRLGAPPTAFVDLAAVSRFTEAPLPGAYVALAETSEGGRRGLRAVYVR
jgi:hypothetical protein